LPGESKTIDMEIAKLHNTAENSIIVRRSKIDGPVVLFQQEFMVTKLMVLRLYDNLSLKINKPKRNHHLYPYINFLLIPMVESFLFRRIKWFSC
jgi:hypothetical protein